MARANDPHAHRSRLVAWAEWAVAALGAAFVLGAVGYLTWSGLTRRGGPPDVSLSLISVVSSERSHTVLFEARNEGDATAAGLVVEGRLLQDGRTVEEAETTLDYLPGLSTRKGGLIFAHDPAAYQLSLSARGYHDP